MVISKRVGSRGFTIVELLIVIVIIAILAAITIAAYNGIQNRARASAASSALSQAVKKLELYKVDNSAYPTSTNLASAGITNANDTTYQYTSDGTTYCLTATNVTVSYYLNSTTTPSPTAGGCPGHGVGGAAAITNLVSNPNVEGSTASWGNYTNGGTISASRPNTGGATSSTYFYRITWTAASTGKGGGCYPYRAGQGQLTAGNTYTFSIWIRSSVVQVVNMQLEWNDSSFVRIGSIVYGSNFNLSANTWTRVSMTAVAPSGVYAVTFPVYVNSGGSLWQAGDYMDCDSAMLTEGSTLYNYADGSSPNWVWNGTANASTSTGPAL